MTVATLRASYTFSASVLQRFNAVVPQGERNRVIGTDETGTGRPRG